jgi:hypothetical protein
MPFNARNNLLTPCHVSNSIQTSPRPTTLSQLVAGDDAVGTMCSAASHMAVAEWYAAWVTGCILITVTNDQQSLEVNNLLTPLNYPINTSKYLINTFKTTY